MSFQDPETNHPTLPKSSGTASTSWLPGVPRASAWWEVSAAGQWAGLMLRATGRGVIGILSQAPKEEIGGVAWLARPSPLGGWGPVGVAQHGVEGAGEVVGLSAAVVILGGGQQAGQEQE